MNDKLIIMKKSAKMNTGIRAVIKELVNNKALYLIALPAILLLFLFNYMPLFGLIIAFKNFTFDKGIFGSGWADPIYNNFKYLFSSSAAIRAIKNTLLLNAFFILSGVVFEVGFALILNEIKGKFFKKITQTFTLLPFFMSWIVIGVFCYNILTSSNSSVNVLLGSLGLPAVDFLNNAAIWPVMLMLIARWKNTGYGTVIYLAVLSSTDASYYEAAEIDGASKWQQMLCISLPLLRPTVVIMTLLQVGRIFNADFGMFYAILNDNPMLYSTTDVIDVFVYRSLRLTSDIGMASAAGFTQSVLSFLCVAGSNMLTRKFEKESSLF